MKKAIVALTITIATIFTVSASLVSPAAAGNGTIIIEH